MHTYDRKWIYRVFIFLAATLFAMPLGVSAAQKLDISGLTEATVLLGTNYKISLSSAEELIAQANASSSETEGTSVPAELTWSSSNTSVASISRTGKLNTKQTGTTMITAQAGSFQYYCTFTVNKPVTKVKLSTTSATIRCGKTYKLTATVKPRKGADTTLKWKSSNKSVAKVNSKGKITAVGIGSCTVTATATDGTGKKAACKVTVKAGAIALSKSATTIAVGGSETLQVQNVTSKNLIWSSSDTSVAKVTGSGKIKGIRAGTAVISVCKSGKKKTATCTVTVSDTASTGASANAQTFLSILKKYSDQAASDYGSSKAWTYNASTSTTTWAEAVSRKHIVNCALLVRWALREMGIIDSKNFWGVLGGAILYRGDVKEQLLRYCDIIKVYKTPSQLLAEGNLLPGDICTWKEIQHTNVYAGNSLWYDGGRGGNYITSTGTFSSFGPSATMSMTGKTVGYIIRLK